MRDTITIAELQKLQAKGKTKGHPEDLLQIEFTSFMQAAFPDVVHIHVANERRGLGKRQNPKTGKWFSPESSKLKRKGVKPGVPDNLVFDPSPCQTWNGLAIELKIKPNTPSKEQIKFLQDLEDRGWLTGICYTFEEAEGLTYRYFGRCKPVLPYTPPSQRTKQ